MVAIGKIENPEQGHLNRAGVGQPTQSSIQSVLAQARLALALDIPELRVFLENLND